MKKIIIFMMFILTLVGSVNATTIRDTISDFAGINNTYAGTSYGSYLYSNVGATASQPLSYIYADNTAFDQPVLTITQDGNNPTLWATNTNNGEQAYTTYFTNTNQGVSTNYAIFARYANNIGAGASNYIWRNLNAGNTTAPIFHVEQASATDDQYTVRIDSPPQIHKALYVAGNSYFTHNITADNFVDHTPAYEGVSAIDDIMDIKSKDGKIDHSTLPDIAKASIEVPINEKKVIEKIEYNNKTKKSETIIQNTNVITGYVEEQGRSIGGMISVLTVAFQEQQQLIETLQTENVAIKVELCKKDNTYAFCDKP